MVPDTRRLRNTWIIDRIAAGVPADVLCAAAGLKSLHQFEDYVVEAGANRRHAYRFFWPEDRLMAPQVEACTCCSSAHGDFLSYP